MDAIKLASVSQARQVKFYNIFKFPSKKDVVVFPGTNHFVFLTVVRKTKTGYKNNQLAGKV